MNAASDRPFSGLKVLVVDDQKFIRGLVAQGLKANGAQVTEAADGFEALSILGIGDQLEGGSVEALKRERPDMFQGVVHTRKDIDVVVSDIRMLPMNGLEMLKAVRSGLTSAHRGLPVVIMSGYFSKIAPNVLDELGQVELLAKPFTTDELARAVHRALHAE